MTRERRFALTVMMIVSGMNALVTGAVVTAGIVADAQFDMTDVTLLVFSIGAFVLAREIYKLRLERTRLISENTRLAGAIETQIKYIHELRGSSDGR